MFEHLVTLVTWDVLWWCLAGWCIVAMAGGAILGRFCAMSNGPEIVNCWACDGTGSGPEGDCLRCAGEGTVRP